MSVQSVTNFIYKNPIQILAIFVINLFIFINTYTANNLKGANSFNHIIDIAAILITIFIAYLFTKLFVQRTEKIELNKSLKPLAFRLTGFRRLMYFLTVSDNFWIKKDEINIAKFKHPKIGYNELEIDLNSDYEAYENFANDQSFSQTRVLLYYIMQEIIKQRYEGWKFNWSDEIVYPKQIVEHLDHPINQLWYYFDYKYYKHTDGLFNFNELSYSYYYNDILKQIKLLNPEYNNLTYIDHKVIGELSAMIKQDVIDKMFELNNVELFTQDMKLILFLSQVVLIFGLIFPLIFVNYEIFDTLKKYMYAMSHMAIVTVMIILLFKLRSIINNEINA